MANQFFSGTELFPLYQFHKDDLRAVRSLHEEMLHWQEIIAKGTGVPKEMLGDGPTMSSVSAQLGNTVRLQQELSVLMDLGCGEGVRAEYARRYSVSGDIPEEENMGETYTTCPVFEAVAVLFEEDKKPVIVLPPKLFVCEGGKEEARTLAIRAIPKEFEDNISKVKVYVRPFA